MDEIAYIERLRSMYPVDDRETPAQALCLADEAVRAFPESPKLWCIRGDLILLGAGEPTYEIADALASYEQAIAVDPKFVEAYEEVAYFYDLVMDDEERAQPFFHQAELLKNESCL